jgi:hypothetical protein
MKNKALLYKLSDPNKIIKYFGSKIIFKVITEKHRNIEIEAHDVHEAIMIAEARCGPREEILEVLRDDVSLWKNEMK